MSADDQADMRLTKYVSDKQLAANRQNARSSTGPKTDKGKATSSRNAVDHGMFAGPTPIDCGPFAEDPAELERDIRAVITGLAPEDDLGYALARQVAAAFVRLHRVDRFEAAAIAAQSGYDHLGAALVNDEDATSSSPTKPGMPRRGYWNTTSTGQAGSVAATRGTSHARSRCTRRSRLSGCRWGHGTGSRRPVCSVAKRTHFDDPCTDDVG